MRELLPQHALARKPALSRARGGQKKVNRWAASEIAFVVGGLGGAGGGS